MNKKLFAVVITAFMVILLSCFTIYAASYATSIQNTSCGYDSYIYSGAYQLNEGDMKYNPYGVWKNIHVSNPIEVKSYSVKIQRSRWYGWDDLESHTSMYVPVNMKVNYNQQIQTTRAGYKRITLPYTQDYRFGGSTIYVDGWPIHFACNINFDN